MGPEFHLDVERVYEHEQDWLVCRACGAQWADHGRYAELVTEGDGHCEDSIREEETNNDA